LNVVDIHLTDRHTGDLVSSHGPIVFHWVVRGQALGTLQLDQPVWGVGRPQAPGPSDLRSGDITAGGQGAPLVPVLDTLLPSMPNRLLPT